MDRAHRIGQERCVLVVRLITPTVMDQNIQARTSKKLDMAQKIISAGRFHQDGSSESQTRTLLQKLVQNTRLNPLEGGSTTVTPLADANHMLARSSEEFAAFTAADDEIFGPEAAMEDGTGEDVVHRLERSGRLVTDVPYLPILKTHKSTRPKRIWNPFPNFPFRRVKARLH